MSERTTHDLEIAGQATLNEIRRQQAHLKAREKRVMDYLAKLTRNSSPANLPIPEATKEEYAEEFEEIWSAYPERQGAKREKKAAFTRWRGMKAGDKALVKKAVLNYARSGEAKKGFARDMVRFLKSDFWPLWISPSQAMLQGTEDFNKNKKATGGGAEIVERIINAQQ